MKTTKIIAIMLFVFLTMLNNSVGAQTHLGVAGGIINANVTLDKDNPFDKNPDDFHKRTFPCIGIVFDYQLINNLYIHTGVTFLQKGTTHQDDNGDIFKAKLSYLELPFSIRAAFGNTLKPYVMAGPTIGFRLDGNVEIEQGGIHGKGNIKEITKGIDFGVGIGAGISYNISNIFIFIESRYIFGLTHFFYGGLVDIDIGTITTPYDFEPIEFRYKGLRTMAGVTFPIGGSK